MGYYCIYVTSYITWEKCFQLEWVYTKDLQTAQENNNNYVDNIND